MGLPKYRVDRIGGERYFTVAGGTFLVPRIMYHRLVDDKGETVAILADEELGERIILMEEFISYLLQLPYPDIGLGSLFLGAVKKDDQDPNYLRFLEIMKILLVDPLIK